MARLVERTTEAGSGVQSTGTFIWNESDVVRVVGNCDTACLRLALQQLRVGDRFDVFSDEANRSGGRIFVGASMLLIGLYFFVTMRVGFGRDSKHSEWTGWMTVALTEDEWKMLQAGELPLSVSRKQLGGHDD